MERLEKEKEEEKEEEKKEEKEQEKKEYEKIIVTEVKNKKKDKQEIKETEGREILKYFLMTDLITNKKYTKLFELEQEKANSSSFPNSKLFAIFSYFSNKVKFDFL